MVVFLAASHGMGWAATPDQNIKAGTAAYQAGDFRQAAQLFMTAGDDLVKAGNSQGTLLWGNAALAYFKAEDFRDAAALYDRLLSGRYQLPQDKLEQYYTNLVICRTKLNEPALAIHTINRMLKALPRLKPLLLANIYAALGDCYRDLELYAPAAGAYEKALKALPTDASPANRAKMLAALGQAQRNMGQYDRAIANYDAASKIATQINNPQIKAEAQSNMGIINTDIGNYQAAIDRLEAALDVSRQAKLRLQEGSDHTNIGQVYTYTGKYEAAKNKFDEGIAIAKEVGNTRGEAVATVNRALVNRLAGELNDARNDYKRATQLFEKCGMKEGLATTHLGQGRMAQFAENDYVQALGHYTKALEIFSELEHPRGMASALLMLGDLYKATNAPKRTTRDMSFDDEPTMIEIAPADAMAKARDYYARALKLAEEIGAKEIIWAAHQGLGYGDYKNGALDTALAHYQKAIDMVTGMYLSREDAQLFGEYMADKEALYNEAQELCAALYDKTKDQKYLDLQLKYADTLNNEIQKASAALASLKYENPVKQQRFEKLQAVARKKAQLEKSRPIVKPVAQNASSEQEEVNNLVNAELARHLKEVAKLDKEYDIQLAQWKKDYPNDAPIVDSDSRVNIGMIQKALEKDQAVLQYITLPDQLIINCIKKDSVESVPVNVTKAELEKLIREKFVIAYLFNGFDKTYGKADNNPSQYLRDVSVTLHQLYKYLIERVKEKGYLQGIKRLYILNDGMLSNLPYAALVTNADAASEPHFLIEDYEIGNIRPAFASVLERKPVKGAVKKMLAVANPANANFPMGVLDAAITEVKTANNVFHEKQADKNIALEPLPDEKAKLDAVQTARRDFPELPSPPERPTETWLKDKLAKNQYELLYLATHGQAQSDTYSKITVGMNEARKKGKEFSPRQRRMEAVLNSNLKEKSPLNGFIYLSSEKDDDILDAPIPEEKDGFYTIKEIIGTDDSHFASTKMVVISACNAAVSMVPFATAQGFDSGEKNAEVFDPKLVAKEMAQLGMVPGVDQVTFVESFMKKGIQDVYASYWPVDDGAAGVIMPRFLQTIVEQRERPDPIAALAKAQNEYLEQARHPDKKLDKEFGNIAIHPYFWAVGAIFGK